MKKFALTMILTLLMFSIVVHAGKIDIRVVSSNTPDKSVAYTSIQAFVNMLWNSNITTWKSIITRPPQFGLTLTSVPNPKEYTGLLLVFDQNATTGNPVLDREIANAYVNQVILPALKSGMRVAIIASPYLANPKNGDWIGSIVLSKLGIVIGKCVNNGTLRINSSSHPIFRGVTELPGHCCLVPVVPDVVAPESLGNGKTYCVVLRVTKWSDEMVIASWRGIFSNITNDKQTQKLMKNIILYLAKELPSKYPSVKVVYKVSTTTVTAVHNVTKTVTETVTKTQTVTNTTTVYKTLTTTVTKTVSTTLTTTRIILQTIINTLTTTVTKTLYSTVTKTLTSTVTTTLTTTYTETLNLTTTISSTITKTLYRTMTVTTTSIKEVTNYVLVAAALIVGIILALGAFALVGRGGGGSKGGEGSLEW